MHAHVHAMPVCGRAAGGDLPFAPCSFEPRWRKRPSERLVGPVRISQQAPPPPRVPCTLHPVPTPPRVRGHLASDDVAHVGAKREQPRETRLHTCMYAYVHDAHACACMHMCMYAYVHVCTCACMHMCMCMAHIGAHREHMGVRSAPPSAGSYACTCVHPYAYGREERASLRQVRTQLVSLVARQNAYETCRRCAAERLAACHTLRARSVLGVERASARWYSNCSARRRHAPVDVR